MIELRDTHVVRRVLVVERTVFALFSQQYLGRWFFLNMVKNTNESTK